MPYSKEHKQMVRKKIVNSAAKEFKRDGINDVSVPKIMKGANLTHGGFYAHFKNKEELVAETCRSAIGQTLAMLQKAADEAPEGRKMDAVIDRYLSPEHRVRPEDGCILPSTLSELSRCSADVRHVFSEEISQLTRFISEMVGGSEEKGMAILSTMVGAVLLARSIEDPTESEKVLTVNKKHLKEYMYS